MPLICWPPSQKKKEKHLVVRCGQSRLGAALAVRVRPGGAGVQVRVVLVVLVLRQALLSYPPVGGAEASKQALVVKAAALFAKWILV